MTRTRIVLSLSIAVAASGASACVAAPAPQPDGTSWYTSHPGARVYKLAQCAELARPSEDPACRMALNAARIVRYRQPSAYGLAQPTYTQRPAQQGFNPAALGGGVPAMLATPGTEANVFPFLQPMYGAGN